LSSGIARPHNSTYLWFCVKKSRSVTPAVSLQSLASFVGQFFGSHGLLLPGPVPGLHSFFPGPLVSPTLGAVVLWACPVVAVLETNAVAAMVMVRTFRNLMDIIPSFSVKPTFPKWNATTGMLWLFWAQIKPSVRVVRLF
jgi:hypothetical protein